VLVDSVDVLVVAGATLLREPTDKERWSVMADPEGNEFCAFVAGA
jgi:predicted enzyme related to lactoylglutathione lyase